jgi:rfaE bifunctional protein nucleotidyltransferase chain/domain
MISIPRKAGISSMENNIFTNTKDLQSLISSLKSQHKKIIFTNGVFDIIHKGHVQYLNQAKNLGDVLIVGLNSDSSVKQIKGEGKPINNENDRAFVLSNLKAVDYVVVFDEDNPYNLIKTIIPDFLVKGGDWKPEEIIGSDIVQKSGGKVLSIEYTENYSTSKIIERIQKFRLDKL